VVLVGQLLTIELQGNIPTRNGNAEALQKASKLLTKIAMARKEAAKAKANRNRVHTTQAA
jgi:hypothetical protein